MSNRFTAPRGQSVNVKIQVRSKISMARIAQKSSLGPVKKLHLGFMVVGRTYKGAEREQHDIQAVERRSHHGAVHAVRIPLRLVCNTATELGV